MICRGRMIIRPYCNMRYLIIVMIVCVLACGCTASPCVYHGYVGQLKEDVRPANETLEILEVE